MNISMLIMPGAGWHVYNDVAWLIAFSTKIAILNIHIINISLYENRVS